MDIAGGLLYCVMATSPTVWVLGTDAVGVGGSEPEHEERTNAVKAKATRYQGLDIHVPSPPLALGCRAKAKGYFTGLNPGSCFRRGLGRRFARMTSPWSLRASESRPGGTWTTSPRETFVLFLIGGEDSTAAGDYYHLVGLMGVTLGAGAGAKDYVADEQVVGQFLGDHPLGLDRANEHGVGPLEFLVHLVHVEYLHDSSFLTGPRRYGFRAPGVMYWPLHRNAIPAT